MIAMIDIPYSLMKEAIADIEAKDYCKHPPMARLVVGTNEKDWRYIGLTCDGRSDKMGLRSTGAAADYCTNCLRK